MTAHDALKDRLERVGLPFKAIDCYGSQIVVTCHSKGAAARWVHLLGAFAVIRGVTESLDPAATNKGASLCPTMTSVHRVFARLA